ncbi:hypothetical protein BDZ88DRAFT_449380 [Geranomyces variabilis]|nr:hypothetical protein BDZ88DRAFT_449380 [Geranomyces variabilis]
MEIMKDSLMKRAPGLAAYENGTERTVDRSCWSDWMRLLEGTDRWLVRYGETGSSAHAAAERGQARLVDWTVCWDPAAENRGYEMLAGESMGSATGGRLDHKIRSSGRTAVDTAAYLLKRTHVRLAVPWIIFTRGKATIFVVKPLKDEEHLYKAQYVGVIRNHFVPECLNERVKEVLHGATIMSYVLERLQEIESELDRSWGVSSLPLKKLLPTSTPARKLKAKRYTGPKPPPSLVNKIGSTNQKSQFNLK